MKSRSSSSTTRIARRLAHKLRKLHHSSKEGKKGANGEGKEEKRQLVNRIVKLKDTRVFVGLSSDEVGCGLMNKWNTSAKPRRLEEFSGFKVQKLPWSDLKGEAGFYMQLQIHIPWKHLCIDTEL